MNWFELRRGRAMGLLNTGNGLAYVTVGFTTYLVSVLGWRETVLLSALAVFVVGMPLAFTLRTSPEPYGHHPDGEKKPVGEDGVTPIPSAGERSGLTIKEAARPPAFHLLSIAQAVNSLGMTTWLVLTVPHLTNAGFSAAATGSIVALYGVVQVVLRLMVGWLGDRIGRRTMFMYSFMLLGIGLCAFALLTPERWWLLPPYYLAFGGGHASQTVVGQTMVADYFGTKRYATICGVSQIMMMPAGLVAPVLAGWIFDRTGDYSVIMLLYGGIAMTGTIWVFLIRRPLWHDYAEAEPRLPQTTTPG